MKPKKKGNPVLALRIPQDLFDRLEAYCKANNTTSSQLTRRLLRSVLLTPQEIEEEKRARLAVLDAEQARLQEEMQAANVEYLLATTEPFPSSSAGIASTAMPAFPRTGKARPKK